MRAHDIEHMIQVNECSNTGASAVGASSHVTMLIDGTNEREGERERETELRSYRSVYMLGVFMSL